EKIRFVFDTIYSFRTKRDIQRSVAEWDPEVAYIHNVYPLISPSVYHLLSTLEIPIVQCVHDFRPFCPNGLFYTHGERCQRCKGGNYLHAVRHCCYKDSYFLSALYATSVGLNRLQHMMDKINAYICLTDFYKQLLLEQGIPDEKIFIRPNSIDMSIVTPDFGGAFGEYAVYLGRLSAEKGPWTLLRAFEQIPEARLKIIGTGPC